jgi:Zn-dependent peptidase ImmA (M78 family)
MKEPTSGRRQPRPVYFTREQLDELCEEIIVGFCMERYGQELNPVPTEALLQLLEEHAHDVDQLAELPEGVNGVTLYYWDRKPTVQIDARLTQQHWRETRRRSTLTHECSHAIQHAPLWRELGPENPGDGPVAQSCRCEYTDDSHDQWDEWMEWQARYMSGSFLMPKTRLCRLAQRLAQAKGWKLPLDGELPPSLYLAEHVVIAFHVSREAAMVRLRQLGFIV